MRDNTGLFIIIIAGAGILLSVVLALVILGARRALTPSLNHFPNKQCTACNAPYADVTIADQFLGKNGKNHRVYGLYCSSCGHIDLYTLQPKPKKPKIRVS